MLHLGRDDVPFGGVGHQGGCDGGVAALRAAGREDDVGPSSARPGGTLFGPTNAKRRSALRITPFRCEVRHHGLQHIRQDGCGGVVVQADREPHPGYSTPRVQGLDVKAGARCQGRNQNSGVRMKTIRFLPTACYDLPCPCRATDAGDQTSCLLTSENK